MRPEGVGLVVGLDDDLIDVHVEGGARSPTARIRPRRLRSAVRAGVHAVGSLLVAVEADHAELGLHQAGQHLGDPDRFAE